MWEQVGEDNGIWTNYKNSKTGEFSIKEHKIKTIWSSCPEKDHYWEITGNREAACKKCGLIRNFIVGKETVKNGKFVLTKLHK